jgi:hypothetical protein
MKGHGDDTFDLGKFNTAITGEGMNVSPQDEHGIKVMTKQFAHMTNNKVSVAQA